MRTNGARTFVESSERRKTGPQVRIASSPPCRRLDAHFSGSASHEESAGNDPHGRVARGARAGAVTGSLPIPLKVARALWRICRIRNTKPDSYRQTADEAAERCKVRKRNFKSPSNEWAHAQRLPCAVRRPLSHPSRPHRVIDVCLAVVG